ncbi:helix-turn-helix domain-containing protein [Peribacillus simplex]|uniref:helix-turn-helix domain-containing protein n=1 Tax=Peribacillus TaxID=2675229 RepID=UPI00178454AC|nr:transposase [Brevibacillus sp. JNUCC-41]QOS88799.1 transposase [Brevibacillus sp. JNUCC-41]
MSVLERKNTGEKYNNEFKKTIVDLYHSGNSVKELCGEYGDSEDNYKWIKEFTPIGLVHDSKGTSRQRDIVSCVPQ